MNELSSASIRNKITFGVIAGGIYTFVMIAVSIIQVRLAVQFLSKDLAGLWFIFLTIATYIAYLDLGISPTFSRQIGFVLGDKALTAAEQNQKLADIIATARKLYFYLSGIVFVAGLVIGGGYIYWIAPINLRVLTMWAFGIFSFGATINLLSNGPFFFIYGQGFYGVERLLRSVVQIVGIIFSVILLYKGYGIIGLSVAWVLQGIVALSISLTAIRLRFWSYFRLKGVFSKKTLMDLISPCIKWSIISLGTILIFQTSNIIIASVMGPSEVTPYQALTKIISAIMTLALLVVNSSVPIISRLYSANDTESIQKIIVKNIKIGMTIVGILVAYFLIFGQQVVSLWLGPGHFAGYYTLLFLLIMTILEVHHVILASAAMASGHIVFAKPAIIAGVLNVIFSIMLIHRFGLAGLALGTLLAQLLTNNWYVVYVTFKLFHFEFRAYLANTVTPLAIRFFILVLSGYLISLLLQHLPINEQVVVSIVSYVCIGGILFLTTVFNRGESHANR